jgi:hypothetical protein
MCGGFVRGRSGGDGGGGGGGGDGGNDDDDEEPPPVLDLFSGTAPFLSFILGINRALGAECVNNVSELCNRVFGRCECTSALWISTIFPRCRSSPLVFDTPSEVFMVSR